MKIQEYISSGILEAYVLDQLSEEERLEVRRMARTYPEVQQEIEAIEDGLQAFAQKSAVTPPSSLKEKIFKDLEQEEENIRKIGRENVVDAPISRNKSFYKVFAFSASVAAVIAIFFSVYYYQEWKKAETQYSNLLAENQEIADSYHLAKEKLDDYEEQMQFVTQPGIQTVAMKGLDIAPQSLALVHWNEKTHQVLLDVKELPETTADKQYQLWAIVDGKPVDAGLFDVNELAGNYHKMKEIENASAFAVTLEPRGGSVSPTMDQMFVLGEVSTDV